MNHLAKRKKHRTSPAMKLLPHQQAGPRAECLLWLRKDAGGSGNAESNLSPCLPLSLKFCASFILLPNFNNFGIWPGSRPRGRRWPLNMRLENQSTQKPKHTNTQAHTDTHTHQHTHTNTRAHKHKHPDTQARNHINIQARKDTHTHTQVQTCTYTHTQTQMNKAYGLVTSPLKLRSTNS